MTDFANYGFKKSHAAAYAFISYRTAYLKAHYAPMYYAALITSVFGNQPKMTEYITECAKFGIKTLPPDINESENGFSVYNGNIRYGLPAIKNVGDSFIRRVVSERAKGRFKSFYDFVSRMQGNDLNRRQIESLIKAGAFDSLGVYRSQLLASCGEIIESLQSKSRGNLSGQLDMFATETVSFRYPDIPEFTLRERLLLEKESAGMYLSGHILDEYTAHLAWLKPVPVRDILDGENKVGKGLYAEKQMVRVAGVVTRLAKKNTKNGDLMAFGMLEDRSGEIELILFPMVFSSFGSLLQGDSTVALDAEVSIKDSEAKLIVHSVSLLISNEQFKVPATAPHPVTIKRETAGGQAVDLSSTHVATESKRVSSATTEALNASSPLKKLWLKVDDMKGKPFTRALAVCEIFSGSTPLVVYDASCHKYKTAGIGVEATPFLLEELRQILGSDQVVLR